MDTFKVGVFTPHGLPESFRVCIQNIIKFLPENGCESILGIRGEDLAGADVLWDPRAGGGHGPSEELLDIGIPLVVTLHGVGPLKFPGLYARGIRSRFRVYRDNFRKTMRWRQTLDQCARIVTVSNFAKNSIVESLPIPKEKIQVVYNGVDHYTFRGRTKKPEQPYFLHISNNEPRKNVARIISAYQKIRIDNKWLLVIKTTGAECSGIPGVRFINKRLKSHGIAKLYRDAGCFVFPSIYEGFGIPIVESMASGCPVITSKGTACEEVSGECSLLVDPRSVSELKKAMILIMNGNWNHDLVEKGYLRSQKFTWTKAAQSYARIFKEAANESLHQ